MLAAGFVRVQERLNQVARCQRVAMRELAQLQSRNLGGQVKRIRHSCDLLAAEGAHENQPFTLLRLPFNAGLQIFEIQPLCAKDEHNTVWDSSGKR